MSSMPPPPPPPPPTGGQPSSVPPYGGLPPGYTPYASAPAGNYASFGIRFVGYLLDQLLYGIVLSIFVVPGIVLGVQSVKDCTRWTGSDGTKNIRCDAGQLKGGLLAAGILLGIIGLLLVMVLYVHALGKTGQTWGRKIVGVKVVDMASGQPLGFGKALGRCLVEGLISGSICNLGYLWMLWDTNKQTWHDKIVSSVVVKI